MGKEIKGISDKSSLSHSVFVQVESRAINSASIVLLAIMICLVDCQEIAAPPKRKTKPDVV